MKALTLFLSLSALPGLAYTSNMTLSFGPFVGSGTTSTAAKLSQASGYSLAIDRNYQILPRWAIGPRIEVINGFINGRQNTNDQVLHSLYDTRTIAAGFRLSRSIGSAATVAQGVYLSGSYGRSYSKLKIDVTEEQAFEQNNFSGIAGDYLSTEAGVWIPIRENLGINLALLTSLQRMDQREAKGTFEGDRLEDGQLELTSGVLTADSELLTNRNIIRTGALRMTIGMGF